MNFSRHIVPLGLAVLLIVGCQSPLSPAPKADTHVAAKSGSLSIKVSAVSAELQTAQATKGGRALLYADQVWVNVRTNEGTSLFSTTLNLGNTVGSSAVQTFGPIPVGSDLTVAVEVLNASSSQWTVSGEVSGVSILEGQTTEATVVCLPNYPYSLVKNVEAGVSLPAKGEIWYSFSTGSTPSYTLTQATATGVSTLLYDAQGEYLTSIAGATPYTFVPNPNTTYYVGVAAGNAAVSSRLTLAAAVFNEGTLATPIVLTAGTPHTFKIGTITGEQTSYYQFTTTTAGSYLFQSDASQANLYGDCYLNGVYQPSLSSYFGAGYLLPNLLASTVYTVRLNNVQTSDRSFTGTLLDPAGIVAISASEGTLAVPADVTVGTPRVSSIGGQVFDRVSYYTFQTGSDSLVTIGVQDSGNSSYYQVEYSTSPIFAIETVEMTYLYPGSSPLELTLSPETRYYLRLTNGSSSPSARTFTLAVSQPVYENASLGDSWIDGALTSAEPQKRYSIPVVEGTVLQLYLEDGYSAGAPLVGDVMATLRAASGSALVSYLDDSSSGYVVAVPSGCSNVLLTVSPYSGSVTTDRTYHWKLVQVATGNLSVTIR